MALIANDKAAPGQPTETSVRVVQISPNNSLTKRGALIFFGSLVAGTMLVSGSVAALGYWPVLPFAGLELFLLGFVLGHSLRRGRYREIVSVGEAQIVIEKGVGHAESREIFPRHWARVCLKPGKLTGSTSRLSIECYGRRCVLGDCLTETERRGLANRLAELIGPSASV